LCKGEEFAALADAVLIGVLPQAQVGKAGVGGIDPAVGVAVFLREGGEAVGGEGLSIRAGIEWCGIAEKFAASVDGIVAVAVKNEEGIAGLDPAGGGLDAVAVVVEKDGGCRVDAGGVEAVTVEVEGQRVAAGGKCLSGEGEGGGGKGGDAEFGGCPEFCVNGFGISAASSGLETG
jgi:hypothetical protein